MLWMRRNAIGLIGVVLAIVAIATGAEAYCIGWQRDEQLRVIPQRLERGEAELAEQHRKSVRILNSYADALRPVSFYAAGVAVVVGFWHLRRGQPTRWLTAAVVVLAVAAVLLALGSTPTPDVGS